MDQPVVVRPTALRQNVADVLRAALLDGRYHPGEELSDSRLAAEFGVSRGPVREALMLLTEEGSVLHRQNHGFEVPRLERSDLTQIISVRKPLEILALDQARERATAGDIEHLRGLMGDLLKAFSDGGIKICARPDFAFHSAVWDMSGNPWLHAAATRISMPYFTYVSAFNLGRRDHSLELMRAMHESYINYIAGVGAQTVEECVSFHLGLD